MTIDEAIVHAREVAELQRLKAENITTIPSHRVICNTCAEEHEQLASWLEELKLYRDRNYRKTIAYNKGRADAIDEYHQEMHDMIEGDEEFTDWQKYEILQCNDLVAEQLKEQHNGQKNLL